MQEERERGQKKKTTNKLGLVTTPEHSHTNTPFFVPRDEPVKQTKNVKHKSASSSSSANIQRSQVPGSRMPDLGISRQQPNSSSQQSPSFVFFVHPHSETCTPSSSSSSSLSSGKVTESMYNNKDPTSDFQNKSPPLFVCSENEMKKTKQSFS